MILKKIGRSRLYDNAHKTVVSICIGLTGIGVVLFGTSVYDFYKRGKLMQAEAAKHKENISEENKLE